MEKNQGHRSVVRALAAQSSDLGSIPGKFLVLFHIPSLACVKVKHYTYTCFDEERVIILGASVIIAVLLKTARLWDQYVSVTCLSLPSCVPISPVTVAVHATAIKLQ